jgi:drug/metabolite transporter (DMT)-like permease
VNFPVIKSGLADVGPIPFTAVRYVIATVILVALLVAVEGRAALRYEGRLLRAFLLGSAGFAGFNILANVALEHTRPQNVALIAGTMPVIALLATWARTRVRPTGLALGFALAAFAGVGLVISRGHVTALVSGGIGGDLLALLGAIGWVVYTMGARDFPTWSPLRYTALSAVTGTLTIVAITAAGALTGADPLPTPGDLAAALPELTVVIVPGTLLAVVAWNGGARKLGLPNSALFMNLVPITTLAIAVGQGYRLSVVEAVGAVVTVAALIGANVASRRAAAPLEVEPVAAAVADRSSLPRRRRAAWARS